MHYRTKIPATVFRAIVAAFVLIGACANPTAAPFDGPDAGNEPLDCAPGTSECSGRCLSLDSDPNNCGGCGLVCGLGETCDGGLCVAPCGDLQLCSGECVDLDSDDQHCGTCGRRCLTGQVCDGGQCTCAACGDDQTCDAGRCVCAAEGEFFCDGECATECACGENPEDGLLVCEADGACIDTNRDPANCGGCGMACGDGELCCGGACTDPTLPETCGACDNACGGAEVVCSELFNVNTPGCCREHEACDGGGAGVDNDCDGIIDEGCPDDVRVESAHRAARRCSISAFDRTCNATTNSNVCGRRNDNGTILGFAVSRHYSNRESRCPNGTVAIGVRYDGGGAALDAIRLVCRNVRFARRESAYVDTGIDDVYEALWTGDNVNTPGEIGDAPNANTAHLCPQDHFMTGLNIACNDHPHAIAPVCNRMIATRPAAGGGYSFTRGSEAILAARGASTGPAKVHFRCRANEVFSLITGDSWRPSVGEPERLNRLYFSCRAMTPIGSTAGEVLMTENLALNMPTRMSSVLGEFAAERGTDGATDNFFHTADNQADAFWEVDLLQARAIGSVFIRNRQDCCRERAADAVLVFLDAPDGDEVLRLTLPVLPDPDLLLEVGTVDVPVTARVVRLELAATPERPESILNIAEVEVYAPEP